MNKEEFREIQYGNIVVNVSNTGRVVGPVKEWSTNTIIGKGGYRLIAKAFPEICGEWFDGCEVDHIDTNRCNNTATNLRVCSPKENHNNPLTKIHLSQACNHQGENNPMYGKCHSVKTKKLISEVLHNSTKLKGENNPNYGNYWSEEQKQIQSSKMKGRHRIYRPDGTYYLSKKEEE